jgi:predicted metalloprotease with PDZ domain
MLVLCNSVFAKDKAYHYFIDLNNVKDDKLQVILTPPEINTADVFFRLPAFVPGTYAVYDFGRFVSGFTVQTIAGDTVHAERIDVNTWKIPDPKYVKNISYWVEDTWDWAKREAFVFEPGGTNIQKDTNFVINTHGFFGYFDGYKRNPFQLEFSKPQKFYGSTSLVADKNTSTTETYTVSDYMRLIDSPIMFCVPDTVTFDVGGAKILVSVYSSKNKSNAKAIAADIQVLLNAQKDYLGGKLPIDKYAFIIYLFSVNADLSGAYGALEHSYSSLYYMPEMDPKLLAQNVRDFASHEFFHIITPLSIHSEEIGDFDYNNPKMSQHLWLYEGVTEYFAGHMQVKQGLIKFEEYIDVLHNKIEGKEAYKDTLPFTVMSSGCLDKYKDQYDNVYQKGALIGLCLDIKLLSLSSGKYGMQNLMADLSKTYGKDRSFKDDELFAEIVKLTYPEIGDFLKRYVSGNNPLPLSEILNLVGINYKETGMKRGLSPLGGIAPAYDVVIGRFYIGSESYKHINDFGKSMGFNIGDEIVKFNGKKLNLLTVEKVWGTYFEKVKKGDMLKIVVMRKDDKGKAHKVKLKVKVVETDYEVKNVLTVDKDPDAQQLVLRKAWLGIK